MPQDPSLVRLKEVVVLPVTERTDRATIAARLRRLNREAMEISRRGYSATRSDDYEARHAMLNLLLYDWQMAQR